RVPRRAPAAIQAWISPWNNNAARIANDTNTNNGQSETSACEVRSKACPNSIGQADKADFVVGFPDIHLNWLRTFLPLSRIVHVMPIPDASPTATVVRPQTFARLGSCL